MYSALFEMLSFFKKKNGLEQLTSSLQGLEYFRHVILQMTEHIEKSFLITLGLSLFFITLLRDPCFSSMVFSINGFSDAEQSVEWRLGRSISNPGIHQPGVLSVTRWSHSSTPSLSYTCPPPQHRVVYWVTVLWYLNQGRAFMHIM